MDTAPDFADLLKALVLLVPRRSDDNLERLLAALREIRAWYNDPAGRRIVPDAEKIRTLRIQRLLTDAGPLDVVASIGQGLTYEDLVGKTQVYEVGELPVRVLDLATIILSKEQANRDKDRATLPILRRTLRLRGEGVP
jgi:hypothetical protein